MDGAAIGGKPKKPLNTVLRLRAAEPEAARRQIEEILELRVKEWRLAAVTRDANGVGALEYRVRLRKSVPVEAVTGELRSRLGSQLAGIETA